jgi:hypothetical protein
MGVYLIGAPGYFLFMQENNRFLVKCRKKVEKEATKKVIGDESEKEAKLRK